MNVLLADNLKSTLIINSNSKFKIIAITKIDPKPNMRLFIMSKLG